MTARTESQRWMQVNIYPRTGRNEYVVAVVACRGYGQAQSKVVEHVIRADHADPHDKQAMLALASDLLAQSAEKVR